MLIRKAPDIRSSEITDKKLYLNRRRFIQLSLAGASGWMSSSQLQAGQKLPGVVKGPFGTTEKWTPFEDVTSYNNFYEFGSDKESPSKLSKDFRTRPWTVKVEGEAKLTKIFDIDELLRLFPLQERVYRLRCVEAWSMVIPWVGFPLGDFIKKLEPTSKAKFIEFTTLYDPKQMPGQRFSIFGGSLAWPYVEGLRMDEALNPLAILAVGLYGEVLPNQNGAPLRLVVPWKYGFKSIKSIVKIRFVQKQPVGSWERANAGEYGFYSNVNPQVDHPRWSQAKERRVGEFFRRPTLMFNGYADQVAHLYAGMDLRKNY